MNLYLNESSIIINNEVVTKHGDILAMTPVTRYQKKNISLDNVIKISFGSRAKDNEMLSKISRGVIAIENLKDYLH